MAMTPDQVVDAFRVMADSMRQNSEAQRAANDTQQQALTAVMGRVNEQGALLSKRWNKAVDFWKKKAEPGDNMVSLTRRR